MVKFDRLKDVFQWENSYKVIGWKNDQINRRFMFLKKLTPGGCVPCGGGTVLCPMSGLKTRSLALST